MLADLIERLEQGTGADRTLDGDIALALGLPQAYFDSFDTDDNGRSPFTGFKEVDGPECFFGEPEWAGGGRSWVAPVFTASLDAVISAMEQKLPGWVWLKRSPLVMGIYRPSDDDDVWADHCEARAPSDSRALMAAVLRALSRR
jgi:hypothetical protein